MDGNTNTVQPSTHLKGFWKRLQGEWQARAGSRALSVTLSGSLQSFKPASRCHGRSVKPAVVGALGGHRKPNHPAPPPTAKHIPEYPVPWFSPSLHLFKKLSRRTPGLRVKRLLPVSRSLGWTRKALRNSVRSLSHSFHRLFPPRLKEIIILSFLFIDAMHFWYFYYMQMCS